MSFYFLLHPYIEVAIQEIQDDSYMVYELCDDTLDNYLGSTPMTEEAALELFKQEGVNT